MRRASSWPPCGGTADGIVDGGGILATGTKLYTADDLLAMGPDARFELDRGVLVAMSRSASGHGRVAANAQFAIESHVRPLGLGRVYAAETGFKLASDPDVVRAPDVAFIRRERVPPEGDGYAEVAPDLVVEVVSPGDAAHEIDLKVADYLAAGVRSIWVLYPRTGSVLIHRPEGVVRLRAGDAIADEPALPGFTCKVGELFA
jgi:Uma2 family endonuclease